MKKFRTLELAIAQYQQIKQLKVTGEYRSQITRAALSVCLNLSEGSAKQNTKDRRRFFNISYASQKKVMTLLIIENYCEIYHKADVLAAHLYRLQNRCL